MECREARKRGKVRGEREATRGNQETFCWVRGYESNVEHAQMKYREECRGCMYEEEACHDR